MPTMDFFWLSWLSRPILVLRAPKSELKRLRYHIPKIANERYTVQALSKLAGWFLCEGYTVQEIDFWCLWYTWAYQKLFSFHIAFAAGASAWVSSESKNIFLLKWINSWRYSIVNEWHVMKLSPEWY